jgi:hypothetical protein
MKNPGRRFFLALFQVLLICACASRPRPPAITLPSPEELPPPFREPFEKAIEKIKQNGKDIDKYFIPDTEGRIAVKSNLRDEDLDFEIIYDLENAAAIGDSLFEVGFSCQDKESGLLLKDTIVWNPLAADAGILLSFDDDYTDSWERYFDLFDKYKTKVTFFIIGKPDAGKTGAFCARALNRGHDVGYHSLNHLDLRRMPGDDFTRETIEPLKLFRDAGIPVSSFAYPYGYYEP